MMYICKFGQLTYTAVYCTFLLYILHHALVLAEPKAVL